MASDDGEKLWPQKEQGRQERGGIPCNETGAREVLSARGVSPRIEPPTAAKLIL